MAHNIFNITHLAEVEELLSNHGFSAPHYYKLGLNLGLSANTLDIIEADYKGDSTRCLLECLKAWLRQTDQVKERGGPSHYALIKALRMSEEITVADGIDREVHPACCILQKYLSNQSILAALSQLAILLHEERVVGTIILPKTGAEEKMLSAVQDSVCADYHNLEKFGAILQQLPTTSSIGTMIRKDYDQKFPTEKKENEKNVKIPSVNEFADMRQKFASAVTDACQAMSVIPSDKLKKYLRLGYRHLAPQLESLETTDDMLELVCDQCSVIDLSLLESVARRFKIEEAVAVIEEYKKNLDEFKPLETFLNEKLLSGSPLKCEIITFSVDKSVADHTIEDIRLLLTCAFKDLASQVKIIVIKESESFTVTCSFPLILTEQLIATAEENIEKLKGEGVKKLTIGYCTVFETDNSKVDEGAQVKVIQKSYEEENGCQNRKLEQLLVSQNVQLLNREQELIRLKEEEEHKRLAEKADAEREIQDLRAQMDDNGIEIEALAKYNSLKKDYEKLQQENEKIVSQLKKQAFQRDPNPVIFEDDVYGDVIIDHPLIVKIIKTQQFQRQKDMKRLGYTYRNIPKATYSRLQHSVGMYYLAGKYVKQLRKRQPKLNITESDVLCVQVAALCYNLGHGPFSYTFEIFLKEIAQSINNKPWKNVSEASIEMFDYMIENNPDLKDSFQEAFPNPEDIEFIKDLIKGEKTGQRKGKEFLYEIVVNKSSGLDICMLDLITHDANVLGRNINFKWRVFINKVWVKEYPAGSGELHTCVDENDLETYNDLFSTRHSIYRELYYLRKNRVIATMINRILLKSSNKPLIKDTNGKWVTITEAITNMSAFTQLTDGVLNVIKVLVDDTEVQGLLNCLDTVKLIAQIGYVIPEDGWNTDDMKEHIVQKANMPGILGDLIIDPIRTGYEKRENQVQHYYSDGPTEKWDHHEWAIPPRNAQEKAPWRVFLVSGDWATINKVQYALKAIIAEKGLRGRVYPEKDNADLMPPLQTTGASLVAQKI